MKNNNNLPSKTPNELIQIIKNDKDSLSLNEFYYHIESTLYQFTSSQLVELLHDYTKANLYNDTFLDKWSKAFSKIQDKTISMVVSTVKDFVTLKYNNNQKIIKTLQNITAASLAHFRTEQIIEVLHSFAKLQPFKEIVKLPSERFIEIKEFVTKIVDRIKADFDNTDFSTNDLSKIIFALAKLEFKDEQLINKWTKIASVKIDEFDTYDLVKNIEAITLLDFYNHDLLLATVNRNQHLLQLNALSNEQKIIEAFYFSMFFINNKTLLTEANINQILKNHVTKLLYNVDINAIDTIYEQREIIFALDNLDLLNEQPRLAAKFTPELIEKWVQKINANIHNEVTITESQQKLISSLRKIQKSGLDITIKAEQPIIRSLGPVDIVVCFNYMKDYPSLIIQDDGLPHYRLSNHEEVTAKTKANSNILQDHGINLLRVNSYLNTYHENFGEIIERFPKIANDPTKNESTISKAEIPFDKKPIAKMNAKPLPKDNKQKKSPAIEDNFEEIIAKFKNDNPSLYAVQKNEVDQGFLLLLAQSPKKYLLKAIEKQDNQLIKSSIEYYKQNKHTIKERKEIGATIYKQLINILEKIDTFNQQKIQQIQTLTMHKTYSLVYAEENTPFNNPEIASGIEINTFLIKDLWLEFEQHIKDENSNNVIAPTISYAIIARNNELLVTIIDIMIKQNVGKEANSILKALVTPFLPKAILYNNFPALEYLLEKLKIDANNKTKDKSTLLYDASYTLNVEAVNYLLDEMSAQPNILTYHNEIGFVPPLYGCVLAYIHKFDTEMGVRETLEGLSPFEETAAGAIAKHLLKAGANTNFEAENVHFIFTAIQANAITIVKHAIAKGEINIDKQYNSFKGYKWTPKEFATILERNEILDLMSKGTNLDENNPNQRYIDIDSADDNNDSIPNLIDENGNVVNSLEEESVEILPPPTKKIYYPDNEEPQNGNSTNCIVCPAIIETSNPEAQNIFAKMFEKQSFDLAFNKPLNFNIFANQNKEPIISTEIKNIIAEKSNLDIKYNNWLNDPEINKLLLSIGPINHRKINQLIKDKGGQPIGQMIYIYDSPDKNKEIYIENFLDKEKESSSAMPTCFDELNSVFRNLLFDPTAPIHVDAIIHNNQNMDRPVTLIFNENGFQIAADLGKEELKPESTVLSDIKAIENNLHSDLFYVPKPIDSLSIASEWLPTNILPLCVLMIVGMQNSIHIYS